VSSVSDICRVGDTMLVKVIAVDDQDRVKLSRKAALQERTRPDEYGLAHPEVKHPPAGRDRDFGPRNRD
jgi:polyribonucleotide nucleotidyltransferase